MVKEIKMTIFVLFQVKCNKTQNLIEKKSHVNLPISIPIIRLHAIIISEMIQMTTIDSFPHDYLHVIVRNLVKNLIP